MSNLFDTYLFSLLTDLDTAIITENTRINLLPFLY